MQFPLSNTGGKYCSENQLSGLNRDRISFDMHDKWTPNYPIATSYYSIEPGANHIKTQKPGQLAIGDEQSGYYDEVEGRSSASRAGGADRSIEGCVDADVQDVC